MKTVNVQGSSSVYTVKFDDRGNATCYQASGELCIGWKNSKAPKTCKHVKLALKGETVGPVAVKDTKVVTTFEKSEVVPFKSPRTEKRVDPMLASKMESAVVTDWTEWVAEEKFDGHRVVAMVVSGTVESWSRSGKTRDLPTQVVNALKNLPNGIYDGELMGREGGSFADVRRVESQDAAYFVIFDVINFMGDNATKLTYDERHKIIETVVGNRGAVRTSVRHELRSQDDVVTLATKVWENGGEGLILKRRASTYQVGKRSTDWVKVKKGGSKVVVVTGFEAGKRGPYSTVVCEDPEDGMETAVKNESKIDAKPSDVGRRLWIDFTEKTATAFVNPHCDRWEDR